MVGDSSSRSYRSISAPVATYATFPINASRSPTKFQDFQSFPSLSQKSFDPLIFPPTTKNQRNNYTISYWPLVQVNRVNVVRLLARQRLSALSLSTIPNEATSPHQSLPPDIYHRGPRPALFFFLHYLF